VDVDAEGLLSANRADTRKKGKVQLEAATQFLKEALSTGPTASKKLFARAEELGIAERTLWRAKDVLEVKASKAGMDGEWLWRLPG
jgi:hypothetical protein